MVARRRGVFSMARVGLQSAAKRGKQYSGGQGMGGGKRVSRAAIVAAGLIAAATAFAPAPAHAASGVVFTNLYSFGANDNATGKFPQDGLTLSTDGNYYGVTRTGGTNFTGTVFQLTPSGAVNTVYTFSALDGSAANSDGAMPSGQLAVDASGNLYGVCLDGGPTGTGTIFEVTTAGAFSTLYTFPSVSGGITPLGSIVLGSDDSLYGTTTSGGASGSGVIYELTPSTGAYTVLHSFAAQSTSSINTDGYSPNGLVAGPGGELYGTTLDGGPSGNGTIFDISTSGAFTSLYRFSAVTKVNGNTSNGDGRYPNGNVAFDTSGNLYGTAQAGGANNTGTVYEFSTAGQFTSLYSFTSVSNSENANGAGPYSGLTAASDGNFYGTTEYGGPNSKGVIYKISSAGVVTNLHTFNGDAGNGNSDGSNPYSALTIGADGDLYGTAHRGGSSDNGVLFKLYTGAALSAPPPFTTTPVPTPVASTRFDFNEDGHADLIWYNTGSGALSVWDMNDSSVLAYGAAFAQLAPSSGWQPVAAPDVNGDGVPDLVWWNNQTGELSAWTLSAGNPPSVTSYGADFGTIPDTTWKPVAAADVTGTTWELVFQNSTTGNISTWQMNGTSVVSYGGTLGSVGAGSGWQCVGAPDLNGDGQVRPSVLEQPNRRGLVVGLQLRRSAGAWLQRRLCAGERHHLASAGQRGHQRRRPSRPDLVERELRDECRWLLDGTTVTQYGGISAQVPDTTWQPTAIR